MRSAILLAFSIAATSAQSAEPVDYNRDIKPLFAEKCAVCHGALKQEAGLRLDAGALIHSGSDEGAVIKSRRAVESRLIHRVTTIDPAERMPPDGEGAPLNEQQLTLLTNWINAGAPFPQDEIIPADPRLHWAYQAPVRPNLPAVIDARWTHPVDGFISREHHRLGLKPVDKADQYTLLRRAYMNLIGLPPTRKQIDDFIKDESDDAWSNVIESLLDSPHYGERWGRHWMDVWRYSDWDGYKQQLRGSQRHIWRWRDWIVQSLNEDKGYDRMIVEMLAADEISPGNDRVLAATGFLARNYHKSNRNIWLDATVEHTAKAFLGMTLNCARCHDHKFDPIPQTAYYEFRAIFEPHNVRTDRVAGQPDVMKDGVPRAFDAELDVKTYLYVRGNDKHPDKDSPLSPAVPAIIGGAFDVQSVQLPVESHYPALRDFVVNEHLEAAHAQLASANKTGNELEQSAAKLRVESLEARLAADRAKFTQNDAGAIEELALVAAKSQRQFNVVQAQVAVTKKETAVQLAESSDEQDAKKRQAAIAEAKKALSQAEKTLKAAQAALKETSEDYTPLGKEYPRTSTGRRSALARWITSRENPLTARVAINQIWMRHFGSPLVDNVFDFGLRSPRPRHAELLDWLAVELMENNWSMKHIHRLLLSSRTWQLASSAGRFDNPSRKTDQDNHFFWRANVRRLDAEIVRDNLLAVSGQLDATMGGADIDFRQGEASRRRSIYLRHAYEKQMKMLVLFDAANPTDCYRRSESIVPQQALALSNSSLSLGQSRLIAAKLSQKFGRDKETHFIRSAFLQVLSRPPRDEETTLCRQFIAEQSSTLSDPTKLSTFVGGSAPKVKPSSDPYQRARENLVHVLMNHNDFVTIR